MWRMKVKLGPLQWGKRVCQQGRELTRDSGKNKMRKSVICILSNKWVRLNQIGWDGWGKLDAWKRWKIYHIVLSRTSKRNRKHTLPRRRWEIYTHTHTHTHTHTSCAGVCRIRLVQGWICWRTVVTMVTKYQVINKERSLLSGKISAFQGRLSFMELNYTSC
jgi:hypothetical protein